MSHTPRIACSLSVLALCLATPALAEVSATELWAEWQATAAATGQQMTADVSETETGLILQNFSTAIEQDGTRNTGQIDTITLAAMPDGTVDITMSDVYRMTVSFPEYEGGPMVSLALEMTHEGLGITASGEPESRLYDYAADTITFAMAEVVSEGEAPTINMTIVASDLASIYRLSGDDAATQTFETEGTIASVEAVIDVAPPEGTSGSLKISFTMGGLNSVAAGSIGSLAMAGQASATGALPEDFDISGTTDYERFMLEVAFEDRGDSFDMFYANGGGRLGAAVSGEEISYDIAVRDMRTRISGSQIPFPIDVAVGQSELTLAAPLAASDTPEDAALRIAYGDVTVSDSMWAMIDPSGQLPRDPATVIFDATAQVQLMLDLLSPEAMEMETPPGELRALSLNDIQVSIGGAELTGAGDMTFAEGQVVPIPVGRVDLNLAGGMGLLDRLVSAGLVPNEQAAMARGIAGMFTRPGAMPDTLETSIEFTEGGMITANGVPLQ
jgi:hypothetical protein